MSHYTEKDKQIAKTVLCRICKNLFRNPIKLPCSENICASHLNDFIKNGKSNCKSYFNCRFCDSKHRLAQGLEFNSSTLSLSSICSIFENDGYSENFSECKELLKKIAYFDESFKKKQQNIFIEFFSDLRLKVNLRREKIVSEINNIANELLERINKVENDFLNKLKEIHSLINLEELNAKVKKYEKELNEYKIDLDEWTQINEKLKQDLFKLDIIREDSNKLVSCKNQIKFKEGLLDIDLKKLFGQFEKMSAKQLISVSEDKSIKVWDLESGECIETIYDLTNPMICSELLEKDKIAICFKDKKIKVLDLKSFQSLNVLNGHSKDVCCLKKINENEIMSGSEDSTIKLWNLNSGYCLKTLKGHTDKITCLEITNDKKIISSSYDRTIKIWNYQNGECLRTLIGHSDCIYCFTLTKDKIISGSYDKTIKIWNIDSGKCLKTFTHEIWFNCIRSFKENQFITSLWNGDIKLWNMENGNCLRTIEAHDGMIRALEVSEDGLIFSGSSDKSIKIWDMESGECLRTLIGHSDKVNRLMIYCS